MKQTFMGVVDLIVREQLTSSCPKDLSICLMQSNPKPLDELSRLADQYLAARDQKLLSKEVPSWMCCASWKIIGRCQSER